MLRRKGIKGVFESIPYVGVDYTTGLIKLDKNTYSCTLIFSDINYQISREEDQLDIFERYSKMLNYFDDEMKILFSINNRRIDLGEVEKEVIVDYKNDGLDDVRKDYNAIVLKGIKKGKGNMKKELLMTIIVKAESYEAAADLLNKPIKELENEFLGFGSKLEKISLEERFEIMHDMMNEHEIGLFKPEELRTDRKQGLTSKNAIAPTYMKFDLSYYKLNNRYYRGLFIKTYADTLDDRFIDELLSTNLELNISIYLDPLDKAKALELIRKKKADAEVEMLDRRKKALKNKSLEVYVPEELQESLDTTKELLENLKKNSDKMFYSTIIINHGASDKKKLDEDTKTLQRIANKHDIKLGTLMQQQEDCFRLSLPLGICGLSCGRFLTTTEAAIFTPFGVQELIQKNGLYYGKNSASGNTLIIDRRNTQGAGHGAYLGITGSGKSFAMKNEVIATALNTSEEIIMVDPLDDFGELTKRLGGEVIKISVDSENYINPFDFNASYGDGKGINLKAEFLLSFFDKLLGGHSGLNIAEKSIIDRCITEVYRDYIASEYDPELVPTMKEFQEVLASQEEKEAKSLATSLEIYSKGSLSVFSHKTNINTENRIICYNLKDLGEALQEIAYLVIMDNIMSRLSFNGINNIPSRLYCDEFHLMINNKLTSEFFIKMFKIARHMHCIISVATQEVSNLLENDRIASTIANSSFLVLLNQNSREREKLAQMLNLSKSQLSYIKSSKKGTGLLILNETTIIPFENILDKNNKIYELISTDLKQAN